MVFSRLVFNLCKDRIKADCICCLICTYDSGMTLLGSLLDVQGAHKHLLILASGKLNVSQPCVQADNTSSYNFLVTVNFPD